MYRVHPVLLTMLAARPVEDGKHHTDARPVEDGKHHTDTDFLSRFPQGWGYRTASPVHKSARHRWRKAKQVGRGGR